MVAMLVMTIMAAMIVMLTLTLAFIASLPLTKPVPAVRERNWRDLGQLS